MRNRRSDRQRRKKDGKKDKSVRTDDGDVFLPNLGNSTCPLPSLEEKAGMPGDAVLGPRDRVSSFFSVQSLFCCADLKVGVHVSFCLRASRCKRTHSAL
jgi:hypothetical protein